MLVDVFLKNSSHTWVNSGWGDLLKAGPGLLELFPSLENFYLDAFRNSSGVHAPTCYNVGNKFVLDMVPVRLEMSDFDGSLTSPKCCPGRSHVHSLDLLVYLSSLERIDAAGPKSFDDLGFLTLRWVALKRSLDKAISSPDDDCLEEALTAARAIADQQVETFKVFARSPQAKVRALEHAGVENDTRWVYEMVSLTEAVDPDFSDDVAAVSLRFPSAGLSLSNVLVFSTRVEDGMVLVKLPYKCTLTADWLRGEGPGPEVLETDDESVEETAFKLFSSYQSLTKAFAAARAVIK